MFIGFFEYFFFSNLFHIKEYRRNMLGSIMKNSISISGALNVCIVWCACPVKTFCSMTKYLMKNPIARKRNAMLKYFSPLYLLNSYILFTL